MRGVFEPSNSTRTATGVSQDTNVENQTEKESQSTNSLQNLRDGLKLMVSPIRFVSKTVAAVRLYLKKSLMQCYSNSHGLEYTGSDIPTDKKPLHGRLDQRDGIASNSESRDIRLAPREQDGVIVLSDRTTRGSSSHSRSKTSSHVQTFLEVGVMLERRRCWTWKASDPMNPGSSRWSSSIDPEITRWLISRKITYRKNMILLPKSNGSKPMSEIFFFFTNIKDARYFASAWGLDSMSSSLIKEIAIKDPRTVRSLKCL